ncbi:MAG TPA: aldehyde dehydrogenase family protein, partial [Duganella sp.]|nr:aldehyde dehydrogenase family protein [Duganella sp.]
MTNASYPDVRLLIDNEWREASGGKTIPVLNPATGQTIGSVAHASIADLDHALAAAQRGFDAWRK